MLYQLALHGLFLKGLYNDRHGQFILLGHTLSCGDGASHRLDKQSLQGAPASLQVCQSKMYK